MRFITGLFISCSDLQLLGSGEEPCDNHVTYIVVGVLVGVCVTVVLVLVVLVCVWRRSAVKNIVMEMFGK